MTSRLLIDEQPIVLPPTLIKILGFEKATVLQQIHWMLQLPNSGVEHEGYHWVWGTYDEWCEQRFVFWESRTLRKWISRLEDMGLLISERIRASQHDQTKYYRIDYDALNELDPDRATSNRHVRATSNGHHDATSNSHHDDTSYMNKRILQKNSTEENTPPPSPSGKNGSTPTMADLYAANARNNSQKMGRGYVRDNGWRQGLNARMDPRKRLEYAEVIREHCGDVDFDDMKDSDMEKYHRCAVVAFENGADTADKLTHLLALPHPAKWWLEKEQRPNPTALMKWFAGHAQDCLAKRAKEQAPVEFESGGVDEELLKAMSGR